jgi:hypothetical protein
MSNLIYEKDDPLTRRRTEVETDAEAGLVFVHSQDTKAIVESAKALAASSDPSAAWRRNGVVHVARIPMVEWNRISRLGITRDPKAFNEYLNLRETRAFRTDDGRKI